MASQIKTVGILGSNTVGQVLAKAFATEGFSVMIGTRDVTKAEVVAFKNANQSIQVGNFAETAKFGDLVVLAVGGLHAVEALELAGGAAALGSKIVIDTTNPIESKPPRDGTVLDYFTKQNDSLIEQLQAKFPNVQFVKAFNTVGNGLMYRPVYENGVKPTMFICGNNQDAKNTISTILSNNFGYEAEDVGTAAAGGCVESLCVLWCALSFKNKQFNSYAFKLLKK